MPRRRPANDPQKTRRCPDGRRATEPVTDRQRASMWVLKEENKSLREIAAEVGCSYVTVQRELASDPVRLESLVTAQREVRSRLWQELENRSLRSALKWAAVTEDLVFTPEGKLQKGVKRKDALVLAPRMLSALRLAGDSSTQRTLALGVRLPGGGAAAAVVADGVAEDMDADAIITQAIELGPECVAHLPERLRLHAMARMEKSA